MLLGSSLSKIFQIKLVTFFLRHALYVYDNVERRCWYETQVLSWAPCLTNWSWWYRTRYTSTSSWRVCSLGLRAIHSRCSSRLSLATRLFFSLPSNHFCRYFIVVVTFITVTWSHQLHPICLIWVTMQLLTFYVACQKPNFMCIFY